MTKVAVPPVLLATITPAAPAVWAFITLTVKSHAPRSTKAILPLTAAETAVQPSAGVAAAMRPGQAGRVQRRPERRAAGAVA